MKSFFSQEPEQLTEKVFMKSIVMSIIGVIVCLASLASATYAWFSFEVTSDQNFLSAGSFDLTVSVIQEKSADASQISVTKDSESGLWHCTLPAEGTYTVCLKMSEDSNVKGFCIVKLPNGTKKCTAAVISNNCTNEVGRDITEPFIFTVKVSEPTVLTLQPRWGESAESDISYMGTLDLTSGEPEKTPEITE